MIDINKLNEVIAAMELDSDQLKEIAQAYRQDMVRGLKGEEDSTLQMLNSYIGLPSGDEQGYYLALDLGGTNVRVLLIRLDGGSRYEEVKKLVRPLVTEEYNLINKESSPEKLFGFIADMIAEAVEGLDAEKIYLGHAFSFGSKQENIYNARLIKWSKEFAVPGVEGQVVNDLLKKALAEKGITNVEPNSVINDTVAILLAAAYERPDTTIGMIYATGYNACYIESYGGFETPEIINMESGGFAKLMRTEYDARLDAMSQTPGSQQLEKMISGRYMGELITLIFNDVLPEGKHFDKVMTSIDISAMLSDDDAYTKTKSIIKEKAGFDACDFGASSLRRLAEAVSVRSARLAAAALAGAIWQVAGTGKVRPQHVAIDGSVYAYMPGVKENLLKALYEILGEDAANIMPVLVSGGCGLGAAIAAASVE
ncbi:MAG: hexokinase [Selenomonadales bacterium]|nr:hexokinase [Selenomonadales bacterium]